MAIHLVSSYQKKQPHALLNRLPGNSRTGGGLADEIPKKVVPGFIDAARIGLPGSLKFLQVNAARAVEEAVRKARERDGARCRRRRPPERRRMEAAPRRRKNWAESSPGGMPGRASKEPEPRHVKPTFELGRVTRVTCLSLSLPS